MDKPNQNEMPLISTKAVKIFLDAVDLVLNSNTFFLEFEINPENMLESLQAFLESKNFQHQLFQQDIERKWFNLHYFDNCDKNYKLRPGKLLKDNYQLKIKNPIVGKKEYLIAMLIGDTSIGNFYCFYNTQKPRNEAKIMIDELINFLFADEYWDLMIVEPDFLKSSLEIESNKMDLAYFEGDNANDSATVIFNKQKGFLILTNGID